MTTFIFDEKKLFESMNIQEELKSDKTNLGGKTKNATELYEMINDFSNDPIAESFQFPAYTYDNESIDRLRNQPGCEGISMYFAKYQGRITIALVAVDKDRNPIKIQRFNTESNMPYFEEGIFGEQDGTGHPPNVVVDFLEELKEISKI